MEHQRKRMKVKETSSCLNFSDINLVELAKKRKEKKTRKMYKVVLENKEKAEKIKMQQYIISSLEDTIVYMGDQISSLQQEKVRAHATIQSIFGELQKKETEFGQIKKIVLDLTTEITKRKQREQISKKKVAELEKSLGNHIEDTINLKGSLSLANKEYSLKHQAERLERDELVCTISELCQFIETGEESLKVKDQEKRNLMAQVVEQQQDINTVLKYVKESQEKLQIRDKLMERHQARQDQAKQEARYRKLAEKMGESFASGRSFYCYHQVEAQVKTFVNRQLI